MITPVERFIAWRYLHAKKEEGFVSTIAAFSFVGIVLGVFALIVVSSIMSGFRQNLVDQILSLNGHITIEQRNDVSLDVDEGLFAKLQATDNVAAVTPLIEEQVLLNARSGSMGGLTFGLSADAFSGQAKDKRWRFVESISVGDTANFKEWNAFISEKVARNLRLSVGDKVEIVSSKGYETVFGWSPRVKTVTVAGVFTSRDDKGSVILPMKQAQLLFKLKGKISRVELTLKNTDLLDDTKSNVTKQLGGDLKVQTWKDFNRAYVSALDVERIVVMIIIALVILVAAFNIIAGQTMLVQEKGKGIAVIRTMGADRRAIMRIFITTGAMIGVVGTILGTVLGLLASVYFENIVAFFQTYVFAGAASAELAWLAQMTPVLSVWVVTLTFVLAISLSILATLYPAWR
ncbi:MAG: ABC transporter permease, partial [Alphaproteobacteria bacterium]